MPIPPEHIKERLNVAYVTAVVAKAGAACSFTDAPEYGNDGHISKVVQLPNGKFRETGHIIHCQLKATCTSEIRGDNIIYDMEVDAYNKLAQWSGSTCILILLCLPEKVTDWLHLSEDQLILKRCSYWTQICGPQSSNKSTQRVSIPRKQLFTPETVVELLKRLETTGGI